MATKISWCDETINPVVGCSKISEGCQNCYAENMAARLASMGLGQYQSVTSFRRWNGLTAFVESELQKPLKWKKPRSIFVGSMGDLFHKSVPFEWVDAVMVMIGKARQHTFIILTKRPERMKAYFADRVASGFTPREGYTTNPLPNLVLGVSVEDQQAADDRMPYLLATPAAKRFISLEPMIGPVNIREHLMAGKQPGLCGNCGKGHGFTRCPNYGGIAGTNSDTGCQKFKRVNFAINGVILGGESGNKARSLAPAWVRTIRDQCAAAGVPFMFKQWGNNVLQENGRPWEYNFANGFPDLDGKEHSALAW